MAYAPMPATQMAAVDQTRRNVLRAVFYGVGASALPLWLSPEAMAAAVGGPEIDLPLGPLGAQDYGPLERKAVLDVFAPTVNHNLWAPAGFDVRVVMRHNRNPLTGGTTGTLGHIDPDGGGVFMQPDGGWIYASNAEEGNTANPVGGVGALRFNAEGELVNYYRICNGTRNNCAGGVTPWGTWITCEEVSDGLAIECDPTGALPQRPLPVLGRRPGREAVAIDPHEHAIYQTLDSSNQPFVRFVSNPDDLDLLPDGTSRMRFESGVSQQLYIPEFNGQPAFLGAITNNETNNARLRQARPYVWNSEPTTQRTLFNGAEGIWYYEIPEALRTIPTAGSLPTQRVVIFATKNDGRVWALDLDNQLIELLMDSTNGQAFQNLNGNNAYWNQVDNVVISPQGDAMVSEDGTNMRLAIVVNNQPAKLLMQITGGGSEICGPAFTADCSKLYFSRQNGPNIPGATIRGTIYEMTIPPRFRSVQRADAFHFNERPNVAPGRVILSETITVDGFLGPLTVTVGLLNEAAYRIDGGEWTSEPGAIEASQTLQVRHTTSETIGEATETTVAVGLPNTVYSTRAVFRTVTQAESTTPDPFSFGEQIGVPGSALVESAVVTLTGFNLPTTVVCEGPTAEYRIDGGAWTRSSGTLEPEQSLQMRHVSNGPALSVRETKLIVGGVTGVFRTRTDAGNRPVPPHLRG